MTETPDDVRPASEERIAPEEFDARIRARRPAGVTTADILTARDEGRRE